MPNYKSWYEFLVEKAPVYHIQIGNPMFSELIDKVMSLGESFLEYGCGTGYTAIAIANKGGKVIGIDNDPRVIELAISNKHKHFINMLGGVFHVAENFKDGDTLVFGANDEVNAIEKIDVVYSQGLLEHFRDGGIISLIEKQLKIAKKAVVFSVPSGKYPYQDMGDERLMNIEQWESILEPFKDNITELYYYCNGQHLMGVIEK